MSIGASLEDIHQVWAKRLGLSEPQWLILMAIGDLSKDGGVVGIDIAAKLHIAPAFVTTQTKSLEKSGFLTRVASTEDARFVLMYLTDKARTAIDKLTAERNRVNSFMFPALTVKR